MESTSDYMTGWTLMTVDKWSSRVLKKASQTLVSKKNSKIMIITGYRCVHNSSGNSSTWSQEKIFRRDCQSRQSSHPGKQFIKDLIAFINEWRSVSHDIMLNLVCQ